MKLYEIERMSPLERRRFLKALGTVLGVTAAPPALRFACNEVAGGLAYAQSAADPGTYFIEICLRDQWDQGHVFVAPGLATKTNLRRGSSGDMAALFWQPGELLQRSVNGTSVFLTNDSKELDPHLDTVAFLDTCEVGAGAIHGHEAANPIRSPGRSYSSTGRKPMFENDPIANFPQGCEAYYSNTPTPASLHNFHQKQLDPSLKNGIVFKGISRSIHTAYHFAAGLPAAELDRKQSVSSLLAAFPDKVEDYNVLAKPEHADAFTRLLQRVDKRFLESRRIATAATEGHAATLTEAKGRLYVGAPKLVSLPLTPEERAYWSAGVPNQVGGGTAKAQIWEQVAYAFKIVSNNLARTVALEFDYVDFHGGRGETLVRTMAKQAALPLARLITQLKAAGLYDRTVIAVYTVDGSRSPKADSYGDEGKNTLILAGGGIRGGYWGDIRVAADTSIGHTYSYHSPDPATGAPGPGATNNSGRLPAARVWRTVMKALKVPDAVCGQFADVAQAAPLSFALR